MKFIFNNNENNPQINLALEEYIVRNFDEAEDYLLFYINRPSIIIGKHQNTIEEINSDYVKEKNITVTRRISGGGAVYHDFGNLNFSFLTKYDSKKVNNFVQFVAPIVEALKKLGISAEMTGRNDIMADGRKISGNAQFSTTKKMFSHGTLLFNSNIEDVVNALNVSGDKITSKGIQSVRSRVANISELMNKPMEMAEFRDFILNEIFKEEVAKGNPIPTIQLSAEQWAEVMELSKSKYQTWEWNYGRSPEFMIQRKNRFAFGQIDARIEVKDGIMTDIIFFGDFLAHGNANHVAESLKNVRYTIQDITEKLQNIDLKYYFGDISVQDFSNFLCNL
jgi:lipoate---protein ligase